MEKVSCLRRSLDSQIRSEVKGSQEMSFNRNLLCYNVNHKYKRSNTSLAFSHSEKKWRGDKSYWNSEISMVLASEEEIPEVKSITFSSVFTFFLQLFIAIKTYICIHIFHLHKWHNLSLVKLSSFLKLKDQSTSYRCLIY